MSLSSEIEQIMRDASDQVGGLANAVEREEYAGQRFVQAAFTDFAGKTGMAPEAAASGGRALSSVMYGMRLVGWIGWFITAVQINRMIAGQLRKVPIVGNGISTVFEWLSVGVARLLASYIAGQLGIKAFNFASSWAQSVGWAGTSVHHYVTRTELNNALLPMAPVPGFPSPDLSSQVSRLITYTHHLQQEIDSIEYRIDHPANGTATQPQVWPQIHALQRAVSALNTAVIDEHDRLHRVEDRQTALEDRLHTLSQQIHGISAIAVTWQDIANQVDQLGNQVNSLAAQTAQDLTHQERQIEQLAPLGLLLQPGISGLKTLRSLEDRPCQCPEFGNVPNWVGTALAVMEFVENG